MTTNLFLTIQQMCFPRALHREIQHLRTFSQQYFALYIFDDTHRFWPQEAKQQVKILKKGLNSSLFPLKHKFQNRQKRQTNAPHKTHILTFYWKLLDGLLTRQTQQASDSQVHTEVQGGSPRQWNQQPDIWNMPHHPALDAWDKYRRPYGQIPIANIWIINQNLCKSMHLFWTEKTKQKKVLLIEQEVFAGREHSNR